MHYIVEPGSYKMRDREGKRMNIKIDNPADITQEDKGDIAFVVEYISALENIGLEKLPEVHKLTLEYLGKENAGQEIYDFTNLAFKIATKNLKAKGIKHNE